MRLKNDGERRVRELLANRWREAAIKGGRASILSHYVAATSTCNHLPKPSRVVLVGEG